MIYEIDSAARANRFFSKTVLYSQIDWSNLDQVVDAFRQRIHDWYLDPAKELAKNIHFAFSVMALNCLLIDALSQFVSGKQASEATEFKQFVRMRMPGTYSSPLPTTIQHDDGKRKHVLSDVADVLYHGFRCGILHQAHMSPYCGIAPNARDPVHIEASGMLKYKSSGADCPAVIIDPLALLEDLLKSFEAYVGELKDRDPRHDALRAKFKNKFSSSFGVDVTQAV
jgi:hypothetical protein